MDSPASSPISYLWNQSTIQVPTRDYQNPNWPVGRADNVINKIVVESCQTVSPIQRPHTPSSNKTANINDPSDDASSVRSFDTHSIASTHSM